MFNKKLLASAYLFDQLLIYSHEGRHLSTVQISGKLKDAAWTPRGNIVYTAILDKKVVVLSKSNMVISVNTPANIPEHLCVSNDNIIYLTDFNSNAIYQSIDDGDSWSEVFKQTKLGSDMQVIKVTNNNSIDFWFFKPDRDKNLVIHVYSVDNRSSDDSKAWRIIKVITTECKHVYYQGNSLSYDNKMNIFLTQQTSPNKFYNGQGDKAVHVLTVDGKYDHQLLSSHQIMNEPQRLAVDNERQLLYVGQNKGIVQVFELMYGEKIN